MRSFRGWPFAKDVSFPRVERNLGQLDFPRHDFRGVNDRKYHARFDGKRSKSVGTVNNKGLYRRCVEVDVIQERYPQLYKRSDSGVGWTSSYLVLAAPYIGTGLHLAPARRMFDVGYLSPSSPDSSCSFFFLKNF